MAAPRIHRLAVLFRLVTSCMIAFGRNVLIYSCEEPVGSGSSTRVAPW
jgi:hypothetical protein